MGQIFFHYTDESQDVMDVIDVEEVNPVDETLAAEMMYIKQAKHRRKLMWRDLEKDD